MGRERKKKRPVSDAFFTFLESKQEGLEEKKRERYKNDEVEKLFRNYRSKTIQDEEYIKVISNHFNKKDEMMERLNLLNTKSSPNPKFNFQVLCSWLPGVEQNKVGKILAKLK